MRWTNWMLLAAAGFSSASAFGQYIVPRDDRGSHSQVIVGDDDQVPVQHRNIVGKTDAAPHPKQKGAYLGVSTSPAPTVIRKQLALPEGMGLVVDIVMPDSPAAAAGLKEFDVLQKLDDQLLVNAEQLAVLVRSHKPGEEIKLTVFREGKPTILTAKLAEREIEPVAGDIDGWIGGQPDRPNPWMRFGAPDVRFSANSLTLIDGDRQYTLSTDAQHLQKFTVKNKTGEILFEGMVSTEKERERVPADLKPKLDKLLKAGHGSLDLTGNADKSDDKAPGN